MTNGRGCDCESFEKRIRADKRAKTINEFLKKAFEEINQRITDSKKRTKCLP